MKGRRPLHTSPERTEHFVDNLNTHTGTKPACVFLNSSVFLNEGEFLPRDIDGCVVQDIVHVHKEREILQTAQPFRRTDADRAGDLGITFFNTITK